jgi:LacI family transcriptional regulator
VRVTIKKIAQELGISHSTVSRVLNDKQSHLVSEATRTRIVQAATRMGYRPNRLAQALQGEQTLLIGILVPDEEDYFFQKVIKNLRRTVEESEYELMVFASSPTQIAAKWQRLLQWDLDGVFVFDYLFYVEGLWEALTQHTGTIPPIVGLFSSQPRLQDYATVDFRAALESLCTHLQQQGCRHFGYMGPAGSLYPGEQRYAIFSEFVRKQGLELSDFALPEAPTLMEAGRRCLTTHICAKRPLPDALFCQNDEIGLGAYRALHEHGIAIPDRILLAGCDDIPYIPYLETPLTTMALPVAEVCHQGWHILQNRMAEPEGSPLQVTLEAILHLRASTQKR